MQKKLKAQKKTMKKKKVAAKHCKYFQNIYF